MTLTSPRLLAAMGLVSVALSGCAGPTVHESLGVRSFDTNVTLGTHATPTPAPPPVHFTGNPGFPAPFAVPPPPTVANPGPAVTPTIVRMPPPPACPKATATSFPKEPATPDIAAPPVSGGYPYRESGTSQLTGKAAVPVAAALTRYLSNVSASTDAASGIRRIDWIVTDVFPDRTSVRTSYEDVHGSPQSTTDGIYLVAQAGYAAGGAQTGSFNPATPVQVMALPIGTTSASQGWTSTGTDPLTGVTMVVQGKDQGRKRVDACGQVVDTYVVSLTSTVQRSGGTSDTVTSELDVATGMGGLFAASTWTVRRTQVNTVVYQEQVKQIVNVDHPTLAVPAWVSKPAGGSGG